MSKIRSKNILGIFAILIMLHHLGQKASAFWVPAEFRRHGLEVFVPIGYLLVSFFFFCSGYGLIKSARTKADYFKGFLVKRLNRILMIFVITEIIYWAVRFVYGNVSLPLNPYSWYVYAIIILYIGFFLIYRKESKMSLLFMGLWILVYTVICYTLIKGNWWFNTAPIFLLGIYVADHEEKLVKRKKLKIVIFAVIFLAAFAVSELADKIYVMLHMIDYGVVNFFRVLLQIIACSSFSMGLYLLLADSKEKDSVKEEASKEETSKESIVQKVLSFYGGVTLEFYLIHGLFVQIFGHHFINDSTKPVCYIENIPLYVLVTFLLATVSAFALKKAGDVIVYFYGKSAMFKKIFSDQKKTCIVLAILFVLITVGYSVHRHRISRDVEPDVTKYQNEYIKYVNIKGTDIAVYTAGEGDYTAVLLGADDNPCSTMYLRPLADKMESKCKVIIIDYPGKGFSGDMEGERTTEFYADLIHDTLEAMGVTDHIILVPDQLSAIYAYRVVEKYPETVSGVMAIDGAIPKLATRFMDGNYSSVYEYKWYMKRISRLEKINQLLLKTTGYIKFQTPIYEYMFYGSGLKDYYPAMEEMHIRKYNNAAHLNEKENVYDNCAAMEGYKLPEDLPVAFLLSDYIKETKVYGVDWQVEYGKMITNKDLQDITIISGDPYAVYYNPSIYSKKLEEFITGKLSTD